MTPLQGTRPAPLFDSHCHLTAHAFADDRAGVLARAREAGVVGLVTIASDLDDAEHARAFAEPWDDVWTTAGIHPHEAGSAPADWRRRLEGALAHPGVVAVGETGLDYHYDHAPRARQRELFEGHLEVAAAVDRPVIVHAREADADIAACLDGAPWATRGVLHCFTGGEAAFARAMERGWYVSFSGIASFRSFGAADMLRAVPEDRLLIETDSPYLAPVPHRGERNEPARVADVARAVAEHLDADPGDVARRTTANARRFYRLDDDPPPAGAAVPA